MANKKFGKGENLWKEATKGDSQLHIAHPNPSIWTLIVNLQSIQCSKNIWKVDGTVLIQDETGLYKNCYSLDQIPQVCQ